jgi:hypothetical protein
MAGPLASGLKRDSSTTQADIRFADEKRVGLLRSE